MKRTAIRPWAIQERIRMLHAKVKLPPPANHFFEALPFAVIASPAKSGVAIQSLDRLGTLSLSKWLHGLLRRPLRRLLAMTNRTAHFFCAVLAWAAVRWVKAMNEDADLLREFALRRDQASFRQLVERRIGFVYAVNLRRLGDAHLAQDATQAVFIALARKAESVARCPSVVGWLHRSSCYESRNMIRARHNRIAREVEAQRLGTATAASTPAADVEAVGAVLDEVLNELPDADRVVILARYFSGQSYPEIGAATDLTENAARMRVERALDKLREGLRRRGFDSTAAVLAGILPAYATAAVPSGLATTATNAALATLGAT